MDRIAAPLIAPFIAALIAPHLAPSAGLPLAPHPEA
jgi:hypothetical protein